MSETTTAPAVDLSTIDPAVVKAILDARDAQVAREREDAKNERLYRKVRASATTQALVEFFESMDIGHTTSTSEWGTGWNISGSKIEVDGVEYRLNLNLRLESTVPERPAKD